MLGFHSARAALMTSDDVSDRLAIQDLLARYCHAVDRRDWQAFECLFTHDAVLDYSAFGGPRGGVRELSAFLEGAVAAMQGTQHTISTSLVELSGDQAHARTAAHVTMVPPAPAGPIFVGLWYRDRLQRSSDGWRIRERVQEYAWMHTAPGQPA